MPWVQPAFLYLSRSVLLAGQFERLYFSFLNRRRKLCQATLACLLVFFLTCWRRSIQLGFSRPPEIRIFSAKQIRMQWDTSSRAFFQQIGKLMNMSN